MQIVTGIPITTGIGVEELSYYTVRDVSVGSIVTGSIRGKSHQLLVTNVEEVSNMKASLRSQHFELQKLGGDAPKHCFDPACVEGLRLAAQETLAHTGTYLKACIPEGVLSHELAPRAIVPPYAEREFRGASHRGSHGGEDTYIQASFSERASHYKNIIREHFARTKSVFILAPTREHVLSLSETITSGISEYVIPLHAFLSKKVLLERWKKAQTTAHPVVIVATGLFLSLARNDISAYICDEESSGAYIRHERSHVDLRVAMKHIARAFGARVILGDTLLRAYIHKEMQETAGGVAATVSTKAKGGIVTLVQYDSALPEKTVLHPSIYGHIHDAVQKKTQVAVYAYKKGVATSVICRDCGTRAQCHICGASYKLHAVRTNKKMNAEAKRMLVCPRCDHQTSADVTCEVCGSWKLAAYGITAESIAADLGKHFPSLVVSLFADTKKSKAADVVVGGSTLLTPQDTYGLVVFPSLESLLSTPGIDADIDVARALARAREISPLVLVHTRARSIDARTHAIIEGNFGELVRSDMALRKTLAQPPYTKKILFTIEGSVQTVTTHARTLLETFEEYKPTPHHELIRRSPTRVSHTTTLSLPIETYYRDLDILRKKVFSLPPAFSLTVL